MSQNKLLVTSLITSLAALGLWSRSTTESVSTHQYTQPSLNASKHQASTQRTYGKLKGQGVQIKISATKVHSGARTAQLVGELFTPQKVTHLRIRWAFGHGAESLEPELSEHTLDTLEAEQTYTLNIPVRYRGQRGPVFLHVEGAKGQLLGESAHLNLDQLFGVQFTKIKSDGPRRSTEGLKVFH